MASLSHLSELNRNVANNMLMFCCDSGMLPATL